MKNVISGKNATYSDLYEAANLVEEILDKKLSDITVREYIAVAIAVKSGRKIPIRRRNDLKWDVYKFLQDTGTCGISEISYRLKVPVMKIKPLLVELIGEGKVESVYSVDMMGDNTAYKVKECNVS